MSDTANTNADPVKTKRRRSLAVRLLRLLAFAGLALVVLLAALIGFTETQTFRSLLRDTIIDAADSSLNAKLSIETIEGNLFSGWVLGGVRLVDASGPVAEIDRVVLRYNIFRAPWKRITIKELTLNAPSIRITKAEGRDWNINTLVRPSEDTDTTSTPFDWVIAVENLRIIDGTLLVWDSTTTGPLARDRLDAGHMQIEDLNLALSALVTPKKKLLRLNQGSLVNLTGDVSLQNLSGDIALRDDGIEIDELSVQTGRSAFILTAAVDGADLLGELDTETLRRLRFRLLLDAPEVDTRDIVYFMPALDFMGGTASLRVNARGTLDDLRIELLQLDAARSRLAFHGRLQRILDGSEMFIDVESDNTVIHGDDLPAILPGIPLMDVSGLGETHFHRLSFTGEPLQFEAGMDMGSEAGAAKGTIELDVRGEDLVYDANIETWGLDLSKVLLDPELRSDLNLQGSIRGSGTEIGRMTAEVRLQADSTRFRKLFANTLSVDIDVHRDSMRFDLQTALGQSNLVADGSMSFHSDSITGIQLNATAGHLDLSRLLDDEELTSDLNFTLRADADGLDPATASGEIAMVLEPSRLKDLRIERDTFLLQLHQKPGSEEYLLLQSQYADARLDGTFDLPRFASSIGMIADSLNASIATYRMRSDSTDTVTPPASPQGSGRERSGTARGEPVASNADTADFMDMRYTLTLKHPERIAKYFNASTFLVRGVWSGTVRGGPTGFDLGGKIEMSDFYYVDSTRTWLAAGVRCTYDVTDLQAERALEQIGMSLRFSAMDLNIDGLRLSRTQLDADWKDGAPSLRLRSQIDTIAQVDMQAEARYADRAIDVTVPRLQLIYRGDSLENVQPIRMLLDSSAVTLQQFDLGNEAIRVFASGTRTADGRNDFSLYADSLDVAAVEYLLTGAGGGIEGQSFTGIGFVEANIGGSDDAPLLAVEVYIDSVGYRGSTFGEMRMESRYALGMLEVYSEITYLTPAGNKENVFFISGSVPLALTSDGEDEVPEDASANLRMRMQEFPLPLIEDFLGLFSPLSGFANADLTVTGTASDPSFNGFVTIADAQGRFIFNNIDYDLGLRIEAVGREINIVDLTVANLPADWTEGQLKATGRISTEAFRVTDFDLAVNGRLKVLRPASRSAVRALYGDLYISTGGQDLTYGGRLDRSMLRGEIVIEQGELVFPLTEEAGDVGQYADINYVVVDDTTMKVTSSLSAGRFARLSSAAEAEPSEVRMPERSMLDGLGFALTLRTAGRLRLEIPFSVLQEELNAELIIDDLQVNNFGGSGIKFVGDVDLGRDSYFIFLGKRMSATGTLRFTRDPQNPDLDLRAVYSDWYYDPATEVRRLVYVIVEVTGTRNEMKLDYDLRWDTEAGEQIATLGDVKSDVVSFLVLGVFTRDISGTGGDRSALAEKSPEFLQQITSSIASSAATEFLGNVGLNEYIRRVDFAGIGTADSRFRLTSEIGRAIITYDGSFNNVESANVSVDFPLSRVLGIPWTNLLIQVSRKSLSESYQSTPESQQNSVWELKILQRFSF